MTRIGSSLALALTILAWGSGARAQDTTPPATNDVLPAAGAAAPPATTTVVAPAPDAPATAPPVLVVQPAPAPAVAAPAPVVESPGTPVDTAPHSVSHKVDDGDDNNWLDYLRIGAIAGVGFPRPLAIEGMAKIDKVVSIGIEYSLLPQVTIDNSQTTFWAILADVRVYPFRDSFFIGLTAGHQHVGAVAQFNSPYPQYYPSLNEEIIADTWLINPRIGFLKTWEWGLTLGIDVGVQIPISSSFSSTAPTSINVPGSTPVSLQVNSDANNVAHTLGTSVLPTVDLLRIGLLL